MDQLIIKGTELILEAKKILVFTGAGLSTESGIPDFRSPGGLWDKYDPSDFYFQKFISDEKAREKYWQMSSEAYQLMKGAVPNRAHMAIKVLEERGKLLAIVTQNIDRLHHKARNSPKKIIELHGTTFSVSCLNCGKKYDRDGIEGRLKSGTKAPYCDDCSGILKPDTISFGQSMPEDKMAESIRHAHAGQSMPEDKMAESIRHAHACDLCIVLGSSLVVYPAASIPVYAVENGAKLMIINRDETPLDQEANIVIHDSLGKTLGEMIEHVVTVQESEVRSQNSE